MDSKIFIENRKNFEEKKKEIIELANLKSKLKTIVLRLQNKKKTIENLNEELENLKLSNIKLNKEKEKLLVTQKKTNNEIREIKSNNIHNCDKIDIIKSTVKNDKKSPSTNLREEFEQSKKNTELLNKEYLSKLHIMNKLKEECDKITATQNEMIIKLANNCYNNSEINSN